MITPDGVLVLVPAAAKAWVLILHSVFANGTATTVALSPYTESQCNEAAEHYEAAARLSVHESREGGDPDMVWKAIAACIPAPNVGR